MSTVGLASAEGAAPGMVARDHVRLRIRQLDACLERLERAHEHGAATLSGALAVAMSRYVPGLVPGMTITHAMDLVMREQEPHLASRAVRQDDRREWAPAPPAGSPVVDDGPRTQIDESGARELTDRIRAAAHSAQRLCSLLVEAHERRAWVALSYPTWADYVRAEFRLSRSRSYELLEHGRVVRALESATRLSGIPDISAYAAAQIRPHLDEVTAAISARCRGLPPEGVARVASQVVQEVRARCISERTGRSALEARRRVDLCRLYDAVHTLTRMPEVEMMLSIVPPGDDHLAGLDRACSWLTEFARAWVRRPQETAVILDTGA
jgi:hypothetical protein